MSSDPDPKELGHSDPSELEPAPSGRRRAGTDPEAHLLAELLCLANSLPIEAGPGAVAREAAAGLGRLLPGRAIGVCVADPSGDDQIVERWLPPGVEPDAGHDPSRLFPELAHEEILSLGGDLAGSTLHIAGKLRMPGPADSEERRLLGRSAEVVSTALRRGRAFAAAVAANQELRRLQAQVIQSEKLASLGQIVAGVVHELNNPLTSIVAYSDYLHKRAIEQGADAEDIERLRRIGEASDRILKFSRDLVAYARPATEVPGPVLLQEVIDKALVFCEHEFAGASVAVERRVRDDLPAVRGVTGQLTQVFVNLFTNASHAMNACGGSLLIDARLTESGDAVVVDVRDDGVGIDPVTLEQIFEPFFTTKSDGKGTGLGLSIVRDIVDAHGGRLTAKSTLGSGATFTLVLPAIVHRRSTRPPPAPD
jgi:two-component system, NtrC family, sensor kinase